MKKNDALTLLVLVLLFFWWRKKSAKSNLTTLVEKCAKSRCGGFDPNQTISGCPNGCKCPDAPANLPDASRSCIPA